MDQDDKNLNESYTEFASKAGGIHPPNQDPTGLFGKLLAKFFARPGRPTHKPDKELRGDTYKAEELLDTEGFAPGMVRGIHKLPSYEYERKKRYAEFEDMDHFPEINAALDIYADDSSQKSIEGKMINIETPDSYLQSEVESLFKKIEIEKVLWDIIRNTAKYGDCFIETIFNLKRPELGIQRLKILNPNYLLRAENAFGYLKNFIQEIPRDLNLDMPSNTIPKKHIFLDKNQIVHFRIHNSDPGFYPYGKSILSSAMQAFRSLRLMEEAMLVYRLTRAPERRVFYIDIGNMPASKAEAFIERQKAKFKKEKFFDPRTQAVDERYNPLSADEDYFVPTRKDSKASRIETLPGAQNLGEVEDVKYFRDKLLSALKVPKDFIVEKDGSPERKANLSQLDVKFARAVVRLQREVEIGLTTMVKRHLKLRRFPSMSLRDFKIFLSPPSDIYEKRRLELDDNKTRVVQAVKGLQLFSDEYLYKTYFNMTDKEIEDMKKKVKEEQMELAEQQAAMQPQMDPSMQGMDPSMQGMDPSMQGMDPNMMDPNMMDPNMPGQPSPGMESDIEGEQLPPQAAPR